MSRFKIVLCAMTLLMIAVLVRIQTISVSAPMIAPIKNEVAAPRDVLAPTAGQLSIVDKNGKTIALCPLRHTDVKADVSGFVARVLVTQQFHNSSNSPIEAVYTFPLPADAAVDDMTMTLGRRVVRGQIKRREEARRIYEYAKANGQAASLLDQERPNIFTQSVANILPGEDVQIAISYVNLLRYDKGKYEFVFPTVVGPRFTPTGGYTTPGKRGDKSEPEKTPSDTRATVNDADKITPPITPPNTRAGHDISIAVNLDAGVPLLDFNSPQHPIITQRTGASSARIRLRDQDSLPNKDFVLRFAVAGTQLQTGVIAHAPEGSDSGYFTLILQPPAAPPAQDIAPKEMIFVIDQTGSQGGWPIEKAKETMRYAIAHLNEGDTFQLIGFNTQIFPCFEKPVAATPENIKRAQDFLSPLQGEGGTDILKSVEYALKLPDDAARPRIICYMTDGYVGNDFQILDYIAKNRGRARMFPFGVGNSVNRYLIDGMAREGRGQAEYVTLQEEGAQAAQNFTNRVANPLLLDVGVDWNGLEVEDVYPKHIPDVFSSGPIILKGRYKRAGTTEITVRGLMRGQPWSRQVRVSLPGRNNGNNANGAAMPTVWAREKIADLEAQGYLGLQSGKPDATIQDQIIAVALEYRLMSQYTSFVAVEQRVVNIGGRQRTIDVPVEMPEGVSYEGIFGERDARGFQTHFAIGGAFGNNVNGVASKALRRQQPVAQGGITASGSGAPVGITAGRARTQIGQGLLYEDGSEATDQIQSPFNLGIQSGSEAAQKQLAAMKPEERLKLLQSVKLDKALQGLAARVEKEGTGGTLQKPGAPLVEKGVVEVQIWLNAMPPDAMQKLKALGFDFAVALTPNKLLLGTLPLARLDEVLALPFVRRVEPPKFTG